MAGQKQSKKGAAPAKGGKGKKSMKATNKAVLDRRALALAHSLADPCNSVLEPGVYPGQTGFITRFSTTTQLVLGAAQTAFIQATTPAAMIGWGIAAADGNASLVPAFLQTNVPGAAFVNANCRGIRCLGACFEFFTNAAPLNAQGTFYYGVVPHSTVANTNPFVINQATGNLQFMSKVNADAYEVKWRPGVLDEQYTTPNLNLSAAEWDDKNTLVLMGTGFPANSTITLKTTIILEWLPNNNIGLATPATGGSSPYKTSQVLHALDTVSGSWWGGRVGNAAKFVWRNGGQQLAQFFTRTTARNIAARALPYVGGMAALAL